MPQDLRSALNDRALSQGGIKALRQGDPVHMARWKVFMKDVLDDGRVLQDLEGIAQEPGFQHLAGDKQALINEWFRRKLETLTPEQ